MQRVTSWFILFAPLAILLVDWWVYRKFGPEATITGVVREWDKDSRWPEAIFIAGCLLLYAHLFWGFPEGLQGE